MSSTTLPRERSSVTAALPPAALPLLASAAAWVVLFTAVPVNRQDFPLNDDWAFGRGALLFAHGEGVHYGGWASMPQLGQWLWACPFVWLLGSSHVALRISTIALSWLGLWGFHDLLRQQETPPGPAALATAALAFNPLFFLLQGTFMTDVPALALAFLALALYGRALRGGGLGWLVGAAVVATLAAVTRQNTLAAPVAAALLLARDPVLRRRPVWWAAVLVPAAAGLAAHFWFQQRPDIRSLSPKPAAPDMLLALPFQAVHVCGLAALPLLLLRPRLGSWRPLAVALAVMLAAAGYWLLYGAYLPYGGLFPYTENMLTPWGAFAGSRTTGLLMVGERPLLLGTPARVLLSLLGCAAGAVLVVQAWQARRAGGWASPLVLFALLQVPFLLLAPYLLDRYLLFLIPGALALAIIPCPEDAGASRRPGWVLGVASVGVLGLASVGLMHDWLAWNAARWELGRRAVAGHIDPLDIEGGFEWDGWYAPAAAAEPGEARWPVLSFTRGWFPATTGHYALSFSPVRGARRLDTLPYSLWLQPGRREFLLVELPPLPQTEAETPARPNP
jgi:4-amino-4-deoxy-L-arabinose transferase-like glycosyltransferase